VQQQNQVYGGVFDRELVTGVTHLGYEIQPKMEKRGVFSKVDLELLTKIT
jgi:hypothetical protein